MKHKAVKAGSPEEAQQLDAFRRHVPHTLIQSLERTGEIREAGNSRYIDGVLTRFLRAEKHDVDAAAARLTKHAAWREQHMPKQGIPDSEVAHQLAQEKVLLQPCGKDGRPLLVIRVAKHHQIRDISEVERFVVYSLEAAATMCDLHPANPDMKMWALFDCEGVKWANMDAHALRSCFHLLNLAFPERVEKIFMLNSPMIFDALWRLVRPFIDPVSRSKVEFVHGKKGIANILETVDPAVVPVAYGGSTEEVDVGSAVRILREQREGGKAGNGTEAQQEDPAEEFFDAEGDCPDV